MKRYQKEGIYWREFELLTSCPNIQHGVIERYGGYSEGDYDSLNLGSNTSDLAIHIEKNREKVERVLNLPEARYLHQVHGSEIVIDRDANPFSLYEADAVITNLSNRALCIQHADCQAILFYDPKKQVIAAAHVGWRGNVNRLITKVIKSLHDDFFVDPKDLRVGIGPSLGKQHAQFDQFETLFPKEFHSYKLRHDHFDLVRISYDELIKNGIRQRHIEVANICTFSTKHFFSYRREKNTGRNMSFILLKKQA